MRVVAVIWAWNDVAEKFIKCVNVLSLYCVCVPHSVRFQDISVSYNEALPLNVVKNLFFII